MKVLIGVDPHKTSVAVAAIDEAKGELLERASFPQNRKGLRGVEVLYTDHMGVRVSVAGGRSYTIEDASMEDLISLVDEAEGLISG